MRKIAIILRGISYTENYHHKYNIPKYTIDARDTYSSIFNNIIEPLQNKGNQVDIFFVTYKSIIENELNDLYKPVKTYYKDFITIPHNKPKEGGFMIMDQHIEGIDLVEEYEKYKNIKYDNIIITRFDLYFYQKITEININYNVFNYTFYHLVYKPTNAFTVEDNFILYPRNKNNLIKECITEIKNTTSNTTTHLLGKYLLEHNETIKFLFGHKGEGQYDYPFYKFGRHLFGNSKVFNNINENINIKMNKIETLKEYCIGDSIYFNKQLLSKIGF